jgi:hypothetical protein
MKNKINYLKASIGLGVFALALIFAGSPSYSYASTYAYVNQTGEVRSVESISPTLAINTAVGRSLHSGVILLTSLVDFEIVGGQLNGSSF